MGGEKPIGGECRLDEGFFSEIMKKASKGGLIVKINRSPDLLSPKRRRDAKPGALSLISIRPKGEKR